jgi:type IV secretory pathway VirD2 relaxase
MVNFHSQPPHHPAGSMWHNPRSSAAQQASRHLLGLPGMSDEDFEVRPGRIRDRGSTRSKKRTLKAQLRALANRSGRGGKVSGTGSRRSTLRLARGRIASLRATLRAHQRRVVVKARIVRHRGSRFVAAPLARHLTYLKRDGVAHDGKDAELFGKSEGAVDADGFAERCADDRHHFRFIVAPEDAAELADVRTFTRELLSDMEHDLGTRLDWVAVDHWNTDNPHIHVLVRGKADDGHDLVIDRDYIREGMRARAEERVSLELGPRSEREIDRTLAREVNADRWTSLDRRLQIMGDELGGVIDLRPDPQRIASPSNQHLIGRATKLERLGLADRIAPGCWRLKPGFKQTLRDLGARGDVIKTMHRAMMAQGLGVEPSRFTMHEEGVPEPVIGRIVERGLHNELTGEAYAVVDGIDGRVHHCTFSDIDMTGDAAPGAIVELRAWTDRRGRQQLSLLTHSDVNLAGQERALGATWLDKQLIASEPLPLGPGFGSEVEAAKARRLEFLEGEGLAHKRSDRFALPRNLLGTLRERDLADAGAAISREHGLPHRQSRSSGEVSGVYRQRVQLASGRFAMIDDGLGFSLVPWSKQLDRCLGQHVSGQPRPAGGIEWTLGRSRSIER